MAKLIKEYVFDYTYSEISKEIINSSDLLNEEGFNLWSFKKLMFLEYYIKPYLQILQKKGYDCIFIDFFGGCGANLVKDEDEKVIGSSIISLLKGIIPNKSRGINNRFSRWYFVDLNLSFCKALKTRINTTIERIQQSFDENLKINKDIFIFHGDINSQIDRIIKDIKKDFSEKKIAVLAFIDPYSFSHLSWDTWKKLLGIRVVDIIFTLPTYTMNRGIPRCKYPKKFLPPSLFKLYKEKGYSKISLDQVNNAYANEIVNITGRSIGYYKKGIKVCNSNNAELYRILLFSHCQEVFKICKNFSGNLGKLSIPHIRSLLRQASGKQTSLDKWF